MSKAVYLKCRNPIMTYLDPQNKFKIPRGKIAKFEGKLTKTMQKWIRRGGLKVVEEEQYLKQQNAEPKGKKVSEPVAPQPKEEPVSQSAPENTEPKAETEASKATKAKPKTRRLRKKKTEDS